MAQEAKVHYGLIYHYFESKNDLFRVAMGELTEQYIADREATVDRSEPLPALSFAGHELWWRAAANFSADGGATYASLGWTYPVLNHELEQIRKYHPDVSEFTAKAHIVQEVCTNFGWMLFRDTLVTGMDIDADQLGELERIIAQRHPDAEQK